MNRHPKTQGITGRWMKGLDNRVELQWFAGMAPRRRVDGFLEGLWRLVASRRRTKFVGFGVFEWRPYRKRLPTGRTVETWRLAFKPSRYAKRYKGDMK